MAEVDKWSDMVFLNKAKVTISSNIIRAAIIVLEKPESGHFISTAIARITWVLKNKDNIEKDYQHSSCPFIIAINEVFAKIRNSVYRYIKDKTYFLIMLINLIH